jgi:hypothetical protein
MKLPCEYLITFLSQLAAVQYISEFNTFMVQPTREGKLGPTAIYIHTKGMGKILTNNFQTNYCR